MNASGGLVARRVRTQWALLAVVVLVAAACSGGDDSKSSASARVAQMVTDVEGEPGGVQDFVIHLDMGLVTETGSVSFYDAVLERAGSSVGPAAELGGGLLFAPVDSLEGEVLDADGASLPTISMSFGLLSASDEFMRQAKAYFAGGPAAEADPALGEAIATADTEGARLLVEILTADFDARRTNVATGDQSAVDLTFVGAISPGDELTTTYLFGATLPGDPDEERGLSPHELFVHRWSNGQVALLSDPTGTPLVNILPARAVEGSTDLTRQAKLALLNAATADGYAAGINAGQDLVARADDRADYTDPNPIPVTHGGIVRYKIETDTESAKVHLVPLGRETERSEGYMWRSNFVLMQGILGAKGLCTERANALNERNTSTGRFKPKDGESRSRIDDVAPPLDSPGRVSCDPKLFRPPSPGGGIFGDVHVRTIDGRGYDNQAAGEFLVYDNGDAVLQLRTEPIVASVFGPASIATAVAARVDGHEVSIHLDGTTWIDDERASFARGEAIAVGDGVLLWTNPEWVIIWPDGTVARVTSFGTHLMMVVTPGAEDVRGMLGDNDGDPDNDLFTRDGTPLGMDAELQFPDFYEVYIDSWRVSASESLFHYGSGESTETFTVADFPATRLTLDDLPAEALAPAEEACRSLGVTRADVLGACVLDLAVTGHIPFAFDAYEFQQRVAEPPSTEGTDADDASQRPSVPGGSIASVGSFTVEFGADPPIVDPNGVTPRWTCELGDGSLAATSRFAETPTRQFELDIQYLDDVRSRTGEARLRVVITLNSQPYAWIVSYAEQFADAVDQLSLDGSTLSVRGRAFLNDPVAPGLFPGARLPDGAVLQPFTLETSCVP